MHPFANFLIVTNLSLAVLFFAQWIEYDDQCVKKEYEGASMDVKLKFYCKKDHQYVPVRKALGI